MLIIVFCISIGAVNAQLPMTALHYGIWIKSNSDNEKQDSIVIVPWSDSCLVNIKNGDLIIRNARIGVGIRAIRKIKIFNQDKTMSCTLKFKCQCDDYHPKINNKNCDVAIIKARGNGIKSKGVYQRKR